MGSAMTLRIWELRGLQEVLGLKTVEVLQTGRQEDQGHWEAWVHVEETHLGPEVGVDKVVEGRSCHCHPRCSVFLVLTGLVGCQ